MEDRLLTIKVLSINSTTPTSQQAIKINTSQQSHELLALTNKQSPQQPTHTFFFK
jgi:hypothetical protein